MCFNSKRIRKPSGFCKGRKYNNIRKKFDTDPYRVISYSKFANKKAKVTFNLKKGWSFQYDAISYFQKTWQKSEDVKNGSIVPIKGGSGFQIMTAVVNDKTGQVEHLLLWFK